MAVKPGVGATLHEVLPAFESDRFAELIEPLGEEIARQVSAGVPLALSIAEWDRFSLIAGRVAVRALARQGEFLFEQIVTVLPAQLDEMQLSSSFALRRLIMNFRDGAPWQTASIAAEEPSRQSGYDEDGRPLP